MGEQRCHTYSRDTSGSYLLRVVAAALVCSHHEPSTAIPANQTCLCVLRRRALDLVNVHLFHDASNLVACNSSPSIYSANRKNALRYVINRLVSSRAPRLTRSAGGELDS